MTKQLNKDQKPSEEMVDLFRKSSSLKGLKSLGAVAAIGTGIGALRGYFANKSEEAAEAEAKKQEEAAASELNTWLAGAGVTAAGALGLYWYYRKQKEEEEKKRRKAALMPKVGEVKEALRSRGWPEGIPEGNIGPPVINIKNVMPPVPVKPSALERVWGWLGGTDRPSGVARGRVNKLTGALAAHGGSGVGGFMLGDWLTRNPELATKIEERIAKANKSLAWSNAVKYGLGAAALLGGGGLLLKYLASKPASESAYEQELEDQIEAAEELSKAGMDKSAWLLPTIMGLEAANYGYNYLNETEAKEQFLADQRAKQYAANIQEEASKNIWKYLLGAGVVAGGGALAAKYMFGKDKEAPVRVPKKRKVISKNPAKLMKESAWDVDEVKSNIGGMESLYYWPLLAAGVTGGGYGGYKLMSYLLDQKKAIDSEKKLKKAKDRYDKLIAEGLGENVAKSASLQKLADAYENGSLAQIVKEARSGKGIAGSIISALKQPVGMALALGTLLGVGGFVGAKNWVDASDPMRKKLKDLERALKHQRRLAPPALQLTPEEFGFVPSKPAEKEKKKRIVAPVHTSYDEEEEVVV